MWRYLKNALATFLKEFLTKFKGNICEKKIILEFVVMVILRRNVGEVLGKINGKTSEGNIEAILTRITESNNA